MPPSDPHEARIVYLAYACECCGRFKARGERPATTPVCPHCGADARELAKLRSEFMNQLWKHVSHGGSAIDFVDAHARARDRSPS